MKGVIIAGTSGLMLLLLTCTFLAQTSCKKENKFIGTYVGKDTSAFVPQQFGGFIPDTLSITAGSTNNSIIITQSPENTLVLNATFSGNNITIPSQAVTNVKGETIRWTGTGTLTGNNLSVTFNYNTSPDTSYTFIGTRQ